MTTYIVYRSTDVLLVKGPPPEIRELTPIAVRPPTGNLPVSTYSKSIKSVRLIRGHGSFAYFMSDDEGTQWCGLSEPLADQVKNGGSDPVLDVVVASDGSWVAFS